MNLWLQRWVDCDWLSWHGSTLSSASHPEPNERINLIKHFQRGGSELQSPHYHFVVVVVTLRSEWSQYRFWRNTEICPVVLRLIIRQQTCWTGVRRVCCWMTLFVLHVKVEPCFEMFCCIRAPCFWGWQDFHLRDCWLLFPAWLHKSTLTYFLLELDSLAEPASFGGDSRDAAGPSGGINIWINIRFCSDPEIYLHSCLSTWLQQWFAEVTSIVGSCGEHPIT